MKKCLSIKMPDPKKFGQTSNQDTIFEGFVTQCILTTKEHCRYISTKDKEILSCNQNYHLTLYLGNIVVFSIQLMFVPNFLLDQIKEQDIEIEEVYTRQLTSDHIQLLHDLND